MAYSDYTSVTPIGTENPSRDGWYEKVNGNYVKTSDATVQNGKTYYQRGYLVKVGNYTIPKRFIKADTFSALWSTTDTDSFRNANNTLHRDSVQPRHTMKVEFETPDISDTDFNELMTAIESQYIGTATLWNGKQAKTCLVSAWMPEKRVYKEDYCYVPDINVQIRFADEKGLRYDPIRIAFIGYATDKAVDPTT